MDNSEVWWAAKALEYSSDMECVWFQLGMLFVIYGLATGTSEDEILALAREREIDGRKLSRQMLAWHERYIKLGGAEEPGKPTVLGKGA